MKNMVVDIVASMTMVLTMKIEAARSFARLLNLLLKFKIINEQQCDRMVDYLTVKVLQADLKDKFNESFEDEDETI